LTDPSPRSCLAASAAGKIPRRGTPRLFQTRSKRANVTQPEAPNTSDCGTSYALPLVEDMKTPKSANLHAQFVKNGAMEGFTGAGLLAINAILLVLALAFSLWFVNPRISHRPICVTCIHDSRPGIRATDQQRPGTDILNLTNDLDLSHFDGANTDGPPPVFLLGGGRNLSTGTIPRLLVPEYPLWW